MQHATGVARLCNYLLKSYYDALYIQLTSSTDMFSPQQGDPQASTCAVYAIPRFDTLLFAVSVLIKGGGAIKLKLKLK
jgi:hypothetical protein